MRLNLIIEYTDGSIQRINSDEKWRLTAQGPIRSNNEYDGEIYDARMELGNWTQPGYDDSKWLKAQRVSLPYGTLRGNTAPNMKVMKTLKPAVFKQYGNRYMIDFGQNMAGWVRINIAKAAAGDTICIRYAERVKNDGTELDVENLRHSQSTDYYICNGKENNTSWSSRFSYHGFQYVEVTGYKNLKAEDLVAEVVYDDLEDNGTFECSNDIMNRVIGMPGGGFPVIIKECLWIVRSVTSASLAGRPCYGNVGGKVSCSIMETPMPNGRMTSVKRSVKTVVFLIFVRLITIIIHRK